MIMLCIDSFLKEFLQMISSSKYIFVIIILMIHIYVFQYLFAGTQDYNIKFITNICCWLLRHGS